MPDDKPTRHTRRCRFCQGQIPDERPRSTYCCDAHRLAFKRKKDREQARRHDGPKDPEHIKKVKELAFNDSETEMANLVRRVFDDAVRGQIDAHIRDNLLGMTEILVDMAPEAIRALREDLTSDDDWIRSRAYALWFKYIMPMQMKSSEEADSGPVEVKVTTVLAQRIGELDQKAEVEVIDTSEFAECYKCHKVKHPDAMFKHDRQGDATRYICMTCHAKKKAAIGQVNPQAILDTELFG